MLVKCSFCVRVQLAWSYCFHAARVLLSRDIERMRVPKLDDLQRMVMERKRREELLTAAIAKSTDPDGAKIAVRVCRLIDDRILPPEVQERAILELGITVSRPTVAM